jgi:hypothetical protein
VDDEVISLPAVIDAYVEQLHFAEDHGAAAVLMASRHLARAASSPADYARVYREVLTRAGAPVILHWLGEAFDPQLAGYFGARDVPTCVDTVIDIMTENVDKVRGIKMSLLDADHEIAVRSRLPEGTTMFTGDDYNYVGLIDGDGERSRRSFTPRTPVGPRVDLPLHRWRGRRDTPPTPCRPAADRPAAVA